MAQTESAQRIIRIATRKSALALWQAEYVKQALQQAHAGLAVELVPMSTQGDKVLDTPLAKIGGKGLFIKELEIAMQEGRADIAVHSMKDVPMQMPEGFGLYCICERDNPFDAFVSNTVVQFNDLPQGAVIGSSSLRRQCQIRRIRPDLVVKDLRGNVNTRLAKLDDGQYDAIILAAAGLRRLNMHQRINHTLTPTASLPAVGQGAVGIECRNDDTELHALLAPLNHANTALCVQAERAMNRSLEGGCQVPIAGFAELPSNNQETEIHLIGRVGMPDGSVLLEAQATGVDPQKVGERVAQQLIEQGAQKILANLGG